VGDSAITGSAYASGEQAAFRLLCERRAHSIRRSGDPVLPVLGPIRECRGLRLAVGSPRPGAFALLPSLGSRASVSPVQQQGPALFWHASARALEEPSVASDPVASAGHAREARGQSRVDRHRTLPRGDDAAGDDEPAAQLTYELPASVRGGRVRQEVRAAPSRGPL
jgi:hypothetical protein